MDIFYEIICDWEDTFETNDEKYAIEIAKDWAKAHSCTVYVDKLTRETIHIIE